MSRTKIAVPILIASLTLALASIPAAAGCCLVVSLEELPREVPVGERVDLSFRISFNGDRPISDRQPVLWFEHTRSGQRLEVRAEPAEDRGRYRAEVTLPQAGQWTWFIEAVGGDHSMPALTAVEAGAVAPPQRTRGIDTRRSFRWAGIGLLLSAAGLSLLGRRARPLVPETAGS